METVLVGRFEDKQMIAAKPSKIIGERCHQGIKEIKVDVPLIFSGGIGKIEHVQELKNILQKGDHITFAIDGLEDTNHLYRKKFRKKIGKWRQNGSPKVIKIDEKLVGRPSVHCECSQVHFGKGSKFCRYSMPLRGGQVRGTLFVPRGP